MYAEWLRNHELCINNVLMLEWVNACLKRHSRSDSSQAVKISKWNGTRGSVSQLSSSHYCFVFCLISFTFSSQLPPPLPLPHKSEMIWGREGEETFLWWAAEMHETSRPWNPASDWLSCLLRTFSDSVNTLSHILCIYTKSLELKLFICVLM